MLVCNLHFDDVGSGMPVLLIHGFPLSRQMWHPQLHALRGAGYRVVAPDLAGFGGSPVGEKGWTMDRFTDDLICLLDELRIERAVIAGMSMGGYILLNLLVRFPERAAAAIFVASRAGADDEEARRKRTRLAEAAVTGRPREVLDGFEKILFAPSTPERTPELVRQVRSWMDRADPRGLAGGLLAMRDRPDYTGRLPEFDLPALVLGGEEDQAVGAGHYQGLLAGLPRASGCLLPGAGHLVNLEAPERFNRCLLDFLSGLAKG